MTPDQLVKNLSQWLLGGEIPFEELRSLGWFEFVVYDHSKCKDAVEMGYTALLYLFDHAKGSQHRVHAAKRIVAFVCCHQSVGMPDKVAIKSLVALLGPADMDREAVKSWFESTFNSEF